MSRKRITYSADFKAKVVLEVLEGSKTTKDDYILNMFFEKFM